MLKPDIILAALANGLMTGAVYALIALGLTLVYGVLHIINFAHGATLTAAMFAVFVMHSVFKLDPYLAVFLLTPLFFAVGYAIQRFVINPASHGDDSNILLVTLGLSIIIENSLLAWFRSDTRSIDVPYGFSVVEVAGLFLSTPKLIAFAASFAVAALLGLLLVRTDTGAGRH
jgi:branched-chain amino acid transport system permease protein